MIASLLVGANVVICIAIMGVCVRRQGMVHPGMRARLSNTLLGTGALILAPSPVWGHKPGWPCVLFAFIVLVCLVLDSHRPPLGASTRPEAGQCP